MSAAVAAWGVKGPLSLCLLLDPEVLANPYPLYDRLRAEHPVYWDPYLRAWVVTRYQDTVAVLNRFSAGRAPSAAQLAAMGLRSMAPIARMMARQMLFLDPPEHTRLRALAAAAFTPRRVQALIVHIGEIAERLVDGFDGRGCADLMAEFAGPLPAIISAELLGLPATDHRRLREWSTDFAEMLGNFQLNADRLPRVLRTVETVTAYLAQTIREPGGSEHAAGLLQALCGAEVDGARLSEEEVIATTVITMVGAQETTTNLIGNGLLTLLRHPAALERLRGQPELLPSAVEELLRYESPTQHTARLAPGDVELGGQMIRKRQAVFAVLAAANRDPERFADPGRLELERPDNRHLAFGWGPHFCFGAMLARLEGQIALETLLRRLPEVSLEPGPLVWRANLSLRGLNALPLRWRGAGPRLSWTRGSAAA